MAHPSGNEDTQVMSLAELEAQLRQWAQDLDTVYPVAVGQPARLVRANDSVMGYLVGGAATIARRVIQWLRR